MKSLISECIVFSWVIDTYRAQNKDNPCSVCIYANEKCLSYLKAGYVPLTGEPIYQEKKEVTEITTPKEETDSIEEKQFLPQEDYGKKCYPLKKLSSTKKKKKKRK